MTTYKVDVKLADRFVDVIKPHVARTHAQRGRKVQFVGENGGYSAVMKSCGVIVGMTTDGVGEKLRIARLTGRLRSIGQDLVAMSANDLCVAMEPEDMFMTDYYATGKLTLEEGEEIVAGIADACARCRVALVAGETAEMTVSYEPGKADLAGAITGIAKPGPYVVADSKRLIKSGMKVWGYPSEGLHSNGYTLVHDVFGLRCEDDEARKKLDEFYPELGCTLGEELMRPTALYPDLISMIRYRMERCVGGFAHVTGGGVIRNMRRILPDDCVAVVNMGRMKRKPIFDLIEKKGGVKWLTMHESLNCGVGLLAVTSADLDRFGFVHLGDIKPRYSDGCELGHKGLVLFDA